MKKDGLDIKRVVLGQNGGLFDSGKKWATGTFATTYANSENSGSVSNLAFTPNVVIVFYNHDGNYTLCACRVRASSIYNANNIDMASYGAYTGGHSGGTAKTHAINSLTTNGFTYSGTLSGFINSSFRNKSYNWIAFE